MLVSGGGGAGDGGGGVGEGGGGDSLGDDFAELAGELEAKRRDRVLSPRRESRKEKETSPLLPSLPASSTSSSTPSRSSAASKNFSLLFSRRVSEKMSDLSPLEQEQVQHLSEYVKLLCPVLAARKRWECLFGRMCYSEK